MFQGVQDTILSEKKKDVCNVIRFFFFLMYLFYVFLAVLGLRCCEWIVVVTRRGYSRVAVYRLLNSGPSVATPGL